MKARRRFKMRRKVGEGIHIIHKETRDVITITVEELKRGNVLLMVQLGEAFTGVGTEKEVEDA